MRKLVAVSLMFTAAVAAAAVAQEATDPYAAVDAAWQHRSDGQKDGWADPAVAKRIDDTARAALKAHPGELEAAWRALRAAYFVGEMSATTRDDKQAAFAQVKPLYNRFWPVLVRHVEQATGERFKHLDAAQQARALADMPGAKEFVFWSAACWGKWGLAYGKMKAARQGVAHKVRDLAEIVIAMDERFEFAGGHRILGRLHEVSPRIPFITGFIKRSLALENLKQAVEIAPQYGQNQLFLAEAEHDLGTKAERENAPQRLKKLIESAPLAGYEIEEASTRREARELLASWEGK
jgi:Ni/Co efflux regulator RcnB